MSKRSSGGRGVLIIAPRNDELAAALRRGVLRVPTLHITADNLADSCLEWIATKWGGSTGLWVDEAGDAGPIQVECILLRQLWFGRSPRRVSSEDVSYLCTESNAAFVSLFTSIDARVFNPLHATKAPTSRVSRSSLYAAADGTSFATQVAISTTSLATAQEFLDRQLDGCVACMELGSNVRILPRGYRFTQSDVPVALAARLSGRSVRAVLVGEELVARTVIEDLEPIRLVAG